MRRSANGKTVLLLAGVWGAIGVLASSAPSFAQEPGPEVVPAEPAEPADTPLPPATSTPAPPPAPPPAPVATRAPEPPAGRPDLDVEKRRFAIGYAGLSQVPIGTPGIGDLTVPAIALRYWINATTGLDFGLGIGWQGGSTRSPARAWTRTACSVSSCKPVCRSRCRRTGTSASRSFHQSRSPTVRPRNLPEWPSARRTSAARASTSARAPASSCSSASSAFRSCR